MSKSVRAVVGRLSQIGPSAVFCRPKYQLPQPTAPIPLRIAVVSLATFAVLFVGSSGWPLRQSRAGEEPPSDAGSPASSFVIDSRATFARLHDQLADLAKRFLTGVDMSELSDSDLAVQKLHIEAAKAAHQRAVLTREAADIALKEYQDGVFPQSKKACDAELELARAELESADRAIPEATQRYARFKQVRTGSAADLVRGWQSQTGESISRFQKKKAGFVLEQDQSKRKVLLEFERDHNLKNLKRDLENARSDELASRASLDLELSKLKKLVRMRDPATSRRSLSSERQQILQWLASAIPLEEQLSARLDQIKKDEQPAESARKDVTDLIRKLEEIVEPAQDAEIAAATGSLRSRVRRALTGSKGGSPRIIQASRVLQTGENADEPAKANSPGPISEQRPRLKKLQEEVLGLGTQVLAALESSNRQAISDAIINLQITVKSAEATFENFKLTREIAEIGVVEYTEGIFKQDEAMLAGEVKLAEADAANAGEMTEFSRAQLAKIKQASRGTAEDLSLEFAYEDKIIQADQRLPRARLALENAQSKLDVLRKYSKPKRVKELEANAEKARLDELAKQTAWELEKSKLKKLQDTLKGPEPELHERHVLTLLDRALPLAEQIKAKLEKAEQDRNPGEHLRKLEQVQKTRDAAVPDSKEIAEALDELASLVQQAKAANAAARWAKSKPTLRAAAARYPEVVPK